MTDQQQNGNGSSPPTVAQIHYDDGRVEEVDIGRPKVALEMSRLKLDSEIEQGFAVVWIAAGKPAGTIDEWIGDVKRIDLPETAGLPTSVASST